MPKKPGSNNPSAAPYLNPDAVRGLYGVGSKTVMIFFDGKQMTIDARVDDVVKALTGGSSIKDPVQTPTAPAAPVPAPKNITEDEGPNAPGAESSNDEDEDEDEGPGGGVDAEALIKKFKGKNKKQIAGLVEREFGIKLDTSNTVAQMESAVRLGV